MRLTHKTSIASLIGAAAVAVAAVPALAATPGLITSTGPASATSPQARPGAIFYTGDGSGFLSGRGHSVRHAGHIAWTSYGSTQAVGQAGNWINNCTPNCAAGDFTSYPVTLRAFKPAVVGGRDIFTRLQVTYTGTRPSFVKSMSQTWTVQYRKGIYVWNFPT
jgi:hypothetical protein